MPTETSLNMPLAEPSPAPIQTSQNMPLDLNISDNFSPPISPSTQREPISPSLFADTPVPLSSIPVSSFQRETSTTEVEVPLQTSQRDSIADDVTVLAANDWNQHHPYNTRFKKKFIANLSTQPTSSEQLPPSFLPSPQSFLSTTHNSPFASSYLDVPSYCLVASNNPDVLHFGSMQRDPDKSHFKADMVWEITDFLIMAVSLLSLALPFPKGTNPCLLSGAFTTSMRLTGALLNIKLVLNRNLT